MLNAILGTKQTQTQAFTENGKRIPVTLIAAGPCWVTKISDHGSRQNLQLAFGNRKSQSKAEIGHIKKAGLEIKPRFLREVRVSDLGDISLGKQITVGEILQPGDTVRITGISKGKGFAGGVKRFHFKGGPRSHGQSDRERAPGSIGQTTTPGRVYRGKRMAGRMGNDTVTSGRLRVVAVDTEKNLLTVKGLVPGARNGLLVIQKQA